jgi:hypothetical protein
VNREHGAEIIETISIKNDENRRLHIGGEHLVSYVLDSAEESKGEKDEFADSRADEDPWCERWASVRGT